VTRVGCTGHQSLTPTTRRDVAAAIARVLAEQSEGTLVGFSSLAAGADQLFALAVLAAGGQLHAIIPSQGYERSFASDQARNTYAALLTLTDDILTLPFAEPNEDAYLAAGHEVADRCDMLVAVWDGQEAAGKGGTGDVVSYARNRGVDVRVIWPSGARRV
jgi:hypothetical protein